MIHCFDEIAQIIEKLTKSNVRVGNWRLNICNINLDAGFTRHILCNWYFIVNFE